MIGLLFFDFQEIILMQDRFDSRLELGIFLKFTEVLVKLGEGHIIGEPDTVGL